MLLFDIITAKAAVWQIYADIWQMCANVWQICKYMVNTSRLQRGVFPFAVTAAPMRIGIPFQS